MHTDKSINTNNTDKSINTNNTDKFNKYKV